MDAGVAPRSGPTYYPILDLSSRTPGGAGMRVIWAATPTYSHGYPSLPETARIFAVDALRCLKPHRCAAIAWSKDYKQ